ncbi:hypothetical protein YC2023_016346 [Brassica napus]
MARRYQEIDALSTNGVEDCKKSNAISFVCTICTFSKHGEFDWYGEREERLGDNKEKYADVSTTKQFEDRILLVSKQKNFNALDSFNKSCYLLQRECLGRIAIIESHKKDLIRPRTKWRKTSESVYLTNALGSIVLLLSLSRSACSSYRITTEKDFVQLVLSGMDLRSDEFQSTFVNKLAIMRSN